MRRRRPIKPRCDPPPYIPEEDPYRPVPPNTPITFRSLLVEEHINSRFIYLMTSIVVCLCAIVLVVAFLLAKDKSWYAEMEGVVLAGGLGTSAGRWLTQRRPRRDYYSRREFRNMEDEDY